MHTHKVEFTFNFEFYLFKVYKPVENLNTGKIFQYW